MIDVYPDDYPDPDTGLHGNKHLLGTPPVHMGGYQELVRGEPFRAKFRSSWEKAEPLAPGSKPKSTLLCPIFSTPSAAPPYYGSGRKVPGSR